MVGLRVLGRGLTTTPAFGPSAPLCLSFSLIIRILKLYWARARPRLERVGLRILRGPTRLFHASISKASTDGKERFFASREKHRHRNMKVTTWPVYKNQK